MVEKANRFARMFFVEQGRRRRRAGARQGGERRSAENRPQRYRFFNHEVVLGLAGYAIGRWQAGVDNPNGNS